MEQRVQIIDVTHLFYKAMYGGMPPLSATIERNGQEFTINTALISFVIKRVCDWSKGGMYPVFVCFDAKGGNRCRKAYFASGGTTDGYKSGRESESSLFYDSIETTLEYLYKSGVGVLKDSRYEADDLVYAAVKKAKADMPGVPIDVITGDADLIPLVDEDVSVFHTSRKYTSAISEDLVKRHYVQITPDNYQDYMEGLSVFKGLSIPYNTCLLAKLLRGDKSDGVAGYPKFYPRHFNKLITDMMLDGVDMSMFRYGDAINNGDGTWGNSEELTAILGVLEKYLDEDILKHVEYVYNGINLNAPFNLGENFRRNPADVMIPTKGYSWLELQSRVSELKIRLKQW